MIFVKMEMPKIEIQDGKGKKFGKFVWIRFHRQEKLIDSFS